ncbi:unnamed protein product [Clavelina lepadiformis]|uniref:Uncharacterized protein n=1 Tax=Clavelina lepadiformis TaxID=159417 RepID=A0ABP0GE65_CLALP
MEDIVKDNTNQLTRDTELCKQFNPRKKRNSISRFLEAIAFSTHEHLLDIVQRRNGLVEITCKTRQGVEEKIALKKDKFQQLKNYKLYIEESTKKTTEQIPPLFSNDTIRNILQKKVGQVKESSLFKETRLPERSEKVLIHTRRHQE